VYEKRLVDTEIICENVRVAYWCNFETVDLESKIINITISVRLSYSFMEISYSSDLCMSTKHYSLLHSLMCLVF